jgi:HNH endonuclease
MNFRLRGRRTVILMSLRRGAPYADRIEDNGKILIYEGHDSPRTKGGPDPRTLDQPRFTDDGRPTQNQLFSEAAEKIKRGDSAPELVRVYEKLHPGVWVFNGVFKLTDVCQKESNGRRVFKFKLEMGDAQLTSGEGAQPEILHNRLIPASVKLQVWKRDRGRCVLCGSKENLHFDHIIPYSLGGSSAVTENIQILCAQHNLAKHDRIE